MRVKILMIGILRPARCYNHQSHFCEAWKFMSDASLKAVTNCLHQGRGEKPLIGVDTSVNSWKSLHRTVKGCFHTGRGYHTMRDSILHTSAVRLRRQQLVTLKKTMGNSLTTWLWWASEIKCGDTLTHAWKQGVNDNPWLSICLQGTVLLWSYTPFDLGLKG